MLQKFYHIQYIFLAGILWCMSAGTPAHAQVSESFSDGNFNKNPSWLGDTGLFTVNPAFQLQSNGTPGTSGEAASLSTAVNLNGDVVWEFNIRFNLSPSSQNFCRFYLSGDQPDLKGALNGYYIQFGGSTGNTDTISLFKQSGSARMRLIAGRPGTAAKNSNNISVKVQRSAQGNWILYTDTLGGNNYIIEGTATDKSYMNVTWTGIYCKYTSSNVKGFYLDDINIYAGNDTTPPTADTVSVLSANRLEIIFSEALDKNSAENTAHYSVNNGMGTPVLAIQDAVRTEKVQITFSGNFQNGNNYILNISGIKDIKMNQMRPDAQNFRFGTPAILPLVINEIMSDPSPVVNLPDVEYVEIFNPNATPMDLSNWTISDGTSTATFSNTLGNPVILPDSFMILCPPAAAGAMGAFGQVALLTGWPSLNNSGDEITLRDELGNIRAQVKYDLSWFGGSGKQAGGWSLEQVNPFSKCSGTGNWKPSINSRGGTPGAQNSVYSIFTDTTAPYILTTMPLDSQHAVVILSEPIDTLQRPTLTMSGISIAGYGFGLKGDSIFIRTGSANFQDKTKYTIYLSGARDCEGNTRADTNTFTYYIFKEAEYGDLVMDEIYPVPLPNTTLPNFEWVEIYNRSDKAIKTTGYTFSDATGTYAVPETVILPDAFVLFSNVAGAAALKPYGTVVPFTSFPSLNNDGDDLKIKDSKGRLIHRVNYNASWYLPSYKKNGGWSLEMTDRNNFCQGATNWKSAVDPSGGTPGILNSVNALNPDNTPPDVLRAWVADAQTLHIYFSEPIDTISLIQPVHYSLSGTAIIPQAVNSLNGDASVAVLHFTDSFAKGTIYEVRISNLHDCSGNFIQQKNIVFGVPETAFAGDLAINELLFNPKTGSTDFIEIYNKSKKVIDLKTLKLANTDAVGQIKDISDLPEYLLMPESYVTVSNDQTQVKTIYFSPCAACFADVSLPSWPDDEGTVVLLHANGQELERFYYNDKMHHPTLAETEGISLERVDFNRPITETTNWQSAATAIGGATPGYRNSQYNGNTGTTGTFSLAPEVFSPDDDGFNDVLNLNYKMPEPGYQGAMVIYNPEGLPVRRLTGQQLLGLEGSFSWNGFDDQGRKVHVGVYIVIFEYFNLKGNVHQIKKSVTVAGKL